MPSADAAAVSSAFPTMIVAQGPYATGFEPPVFTVGFLGTQGGWQTFVANLKQPRIDNIAPAADTQHLRIARDPFLPPGVLVGGFSPTRSLLPGPVVISVSVQISNTGGANYEVIPQAPSQGLVATRVCFYFDDADGDSRAGDILVLDRTPQGVEFVPTGAEYVVGAYRELLIKFDPLPRQAIEYFYGGELIYTGHSLVGADTVEQIVLLSDNFQLESEAADFDNLSLFDSSVPSCATCPGDTTSDGRVDGRDIQRFVECLFAGPSPAPGCACADLNANGSIEPADVDFLVRRLLGITGTDPDCV